VPMSQHDQARIDEFFAEITSFEPAYRFPTFRYIVMRCKGEWILLHGIIALNTTSVGISEPFESSDICAGEVSLSGIASPRDLLMHLLSGRITLAGREVVFPGEQSGNHTAHNWPFDGSQQPRDRAGSVTIRGSNNYYHFAQEPTIIRQLKTSHGAFNSIAELAAHYGMKFEIGMNLHVEIYAPSIAEVTKNSRLAFDDAHIELKLAGSLEPARVNLSMRGRTHESIESRLTAPAMSWNRDENMDWICMSNIPFPDGESLDCILSYEGFVQHELNVEEPVAFRNTLRFAYDLFDPEAKAFERVIEDRKIKNRDGRELENAIASILSLAGFRVLAADHLPGLEEAPDIIAADTRGNLLVVECTLSLPNAADKMGKLSRRHHTIRQALDDVGLGYIKTISLLAVALPNDKIASYLDDARKAGISIWGRESLHEFKKRAETQPADDLFDALLAEAALLQLQQTYEEF
jgi:hypothetical protein